MKAPRGIGLGIFASVFVLQSGLLWGQSQVMSCRSPEKGATVVVCDYRLSEPAEIKETKARLGEKSYSVTSSKSYPQEGQKSAIYFLVDTSDKTRQLTVSKNGELVAGWAGKVASHHRIGLAVFDSEMNELLPLGSSPEKVAEAAKKLTAKGMTTELYHSMLTAITKLAAEPAQRKGLVIFSDGLAEDKAYNHEDVVAKAREEGVVIFGLGYAFSVAKSTELQRLRRLAEDTNGFYLSADAKGELPGRFINNFFAYLDNGGSVTFDFAGHFAAQKVEIVHTLVDGGTVSHHQEITLPPVPVVPQPPEPWYRVYGDYLFAAGGGLLLLIFLLARKGGEKKPPPSGPPLAFLLLDGEPDKRQAMTRPVWRIGRKPDNDLKLTDDSVSGYHAEIHRNRDGRFVLTDLSSTNGVLVNGELGNNHVLKSGDLVEVGDVRLRFVIP